ncbi:hypothetical protein Bca4012_043898 [Brassica carinata]
MVLRLQTGFSDLKSILALACHFPGSSSPPMDICLMTESQEKLDEVSSLVPSELPLRWRDGHAADGELARTLLLLKQRHLDTQAQLAVRASTTTRWKSLVSAGMVGARPRSDPAEVLQGAGPCSVTAWSMEHGGGAGQDRIG